LGSRSADDGRSRVRGLSRWLIVDAAVLAVIVIGASVEHEQIANWVESALGIPEEWTKIAVVAGAGLLASPFAIGLVRLARVLGFDLALRVFPLAGGEELDRAAAPRRLLVVTLQLAIVIFVGVPLLSITAPFLPLYSAAGVLLFVVLLLAFAFWRGATNFQGHTRAAAQALAESLTRQTRKGRVVGELQEAAQHVVGGDHLFAGLGTPAPVELAPGAAVVGKTLAEIKLRGLTGATILAIQRGDHSIPVPSGHERLNEGDILAIAGTQESIEAAKELLSAE
jgi:monovalent cation:H+ antiporter-2, CPA2 family